MRRSRLLRYLLAATVGVVFLVAGLGDVASQGRGTAAFVQSLGVPAEIAAVLPAVVPGVNLAIGIALLGGWHSIWLFAVAFAALLNYLIVLSASALLGTSPNNCPCFTGAAAMWFGGSIQIAIGRNVLLISMVAWAGWLTYCYGRPDTRPDRKRYLNAIDR